MITLHTRECVFKLICVRAAFSGAARLFWILSDQASQIGRAVGQRVGIR